VRPHAGRAGSGPARLAAAVLAATALLGCSSTPSGGDADPGAGTGPADRSTTAATATSIESELTVPATGAASTETTSAPFDGAVLGEVSDPDQVVALRIESRVDDITTGELERQVLAWLGHPDGWARAGFRFLSADSSPFLVILAEGDEVDGLCSPLETFGSVSCQNGPVVALNADRWRQAVDHRDGPIADYRGYLVNHEVGHLLGQRHPEPRCPIAGRPAAVMEQQTGGLEGCTGNPLPRDWEIELARQRPVVYAPLPDWAPDPVPVNGEA
jgi:hypothetical protein